MVPSLAFIALNPNFSIAIIGCSFVRVRINLKAVLTVLLIIEVLDTLLTKVHLVAVRQSYTHELIVVVGAHYIEAVLGVDGALATTLFTVRVFFGFLGSTLTNDLFSWYGGGGLL